ncbi:helix-turn-helix domain-containing protein [Kribbella pittospori]|uniref:Helix-turn-helix domain-containing protein n=1 Tax=Kribbella pittospori TaxID=722689 RepID=A0A4R0K506_9ACTN|nr:helix-turn-helix domain-containing protein [Kribbella pittospori]
MLNTAPLWNPCVNESPIATSRCLGVPLRFANLISGTPTVASNCGTLGSFFDRSLTSLGALSATEISPEAGIVSPWSSLLQTLIRTQDTCQRLVGKVGGYASIVGVGGHPWGGEQRFGDVLRRYRTLAGLSQQALAQQSGLSRRGIADLERGARNSPYPDTARRLADALRLTSPDRAVFMAACRRGDAPARYTLPIEPAPIVGRQAELDELVRRAETARLLTLTGPGGVGKTRLALELARRTEPAYVDGAVIVALAPVADDTVVAATVATALGVTLRPGESAEECVREHLRSRQVLLLLDNCEHMVVACAQLTDRLLRDAPGLRVLATSREQLRIPGETVWVVPPLTAGDAVELLSRQARNAGAAAFTRDELLLVGEVCDRLEGLPLAIELTAAHIPALGVAQVAELLTDRLDFLARGSRVDPPRHRTLRAALDWSFALLDPTEQKVMVQLASFRGGWSLEGARAVCARGDISRAALVGALEGLVEKSLVAVEDAGDVRRYRFLETIREYAAEHLDATHDAEVTRDRHVKHFLMLAEDGAVTRLGIRYPQDMARLRLEHANLRAALRWLLDGHRIDEGLRLCQALGGFWLSQGFLAEGDEWFARFLDRAAGRPSPMVAAGLHSWGRLAEYAGDLDRAMELFERSRTISSTVNDRTIWARACCGLGDLALHHSGYAEAVALYKSAVEAARDAGSVPEEAQALLCLGRATSLMGDPEQSMGWLEQALVLERQLGDGWGIAYALNETAQQARRAGRLEQARRLLEECHVLWRQAGTRMGERAALMNLALVTLELGDVRRAAELAGDSLEVSQEVGDDGSTASVRCIEIAAQTVAARGAMSTAVCLTAIASERRAGLGAPRPSIEEAEISRLVVRAREQLGESGFEAAWSRGLGVPIADAVDLAAEGLTASLETSEH